MKIIQNFIIFKESIQKLIEWFPVIWKDRDWDQAYIYRLLEHKFDSMSKYQRKYGHSTSANKIADKLQEAKDLCHKLLNYDYSEESMKSFHEKYPEFEIKYSFEPYNKNLLKMKDNLNEEQKEELIKSAKIEQELYDNDKNKLFDLLKNHIEEFWD